MELLSRPSEAQVTGTGFKSLQTSEGRQRRKSHVWRGDAVKGNTPAYSTARAAPAWGQVLRALRLPDASAVPRSEGFVSRTRGIINRIWSIAVCLERAISTSFNRDLRTGRSLSVWRDPASLKNRWAEFVLQVPDALIDQRAREASRQAWSRCCSEARRRGEWWRVIGRRRGDEMRRRVRHGRTGTAMRTRSVRLQSRIACIG